jgi:DNA adenine methylase
MEKMVLSRRKNQLVRPVLKWAGGKRQLLPALTAAIQGLHYTRYFEPFIGGGALWLHLQPKQYLISDTNPELINVYRVIQEDLDALLEELAKHENSAEYFYALRAIDRSAEYNSWTAVQKAARIIYLNKTCYNGLFRVNSQGFFNVPFGNYAQPEIINEPVLSAVHEYLNASQGQMLVGDFSEILAQHPKAGDFVYLDPPYDPVSDSASFTGYALGGFSKHDQQRLKVACDSLNQRDILWLQSNSDTPFIRDLYRDYCIVQVQANRAINSSGEKRGAVAELLIGNFEVRANRYSI